MAEIRRMILKVLASEEGSYRGAPEQSRVYKRIANSGAALDAINRIVGDDAGEGSIFRLLNSCVMAEIARQRFPRVVAAKQATEDRLKCHRKSVKDLHRFIVATQDIEFPIGWPVVKIEAKNADYQDEWYEKSAEFYKDALDRIASLIDRQQKIIAQVTHMLAVNQKSATKTAAENAGIGLLAGYVVDVTGKPFARLVATLAAVAFDIGEGHISEDRVREILKKRRKRSVDLT